MASFDKLYVYDSSSEEDVDQASGRFNASDHVYHLGVSSREELVARWDMLKRGGYRFSRVLFQTHGQAGAIKFNDRTIWDVTIKREFDPRNYHTMFPGWTKFYFDGCSVGEGSLGDEFMRQVGASFLKLGGGEVIAWTSPGYGMSSWWPFIGGHTIHFGGTLKRMRFATGGALITEAPSPSVWGSERKGQKDYIGHNF